MLGQAFIIIIVLIYGALLGNYLTTAFYRIPCGQPLNGLSKKYGKKPHCSNCGHELKYYEYFPILSWICTKFRCNYCAAPTDRAYTFLEVYMMVVSALVYYLLGFNVEYVLFTLFLSTLILFAALYQRHKRVYYQSIFFILGTFVFFIMSFLI